MRFSIEKNELVRHIQHLATVVGSKTTSPIMLNYLLEVDAGTNSVKLTASDLELTAKVTFSASVMEGGMVAVNARYFNEIISNMPEALIDVWKTEEILMIQCNKVKFNILCADASLYPLLPDPELEGSSSINAELFMKMVARTSFSVSQDVQRTVLTGVCWKIMNDRHIMAATDGRKVAEFVIKAAQAPGEETEARDDSASEIDETKYIERIIPVKTLHFLQRIQDSTEKEIHVILQDNKIIFSYGKFVVISNIIDQKYPEYRKAFINDLPNTLLVDLNTLKTAIKRISLLAPEEAQRIRFEIDAENFEINTSDRDTGDAKETIEGYTYQGSATSIAFNFRFMQAILDVIDTDKVRIHMGSGKDPMMIYNETDPENQQITFLLMPLRS